MTEKKNKKKKIIRIALIPVLLAVLLLGIYTVYSLAHTSEALHTVEEYQEFYSDLTITEDSEGSVSLLPNDESKSNHMGIIFYQGASVEPLAYVPLLSGLAEDGYSIYAPKFPCGMAVFDSDAADLVMEQHPEIEAWYIAGHSMGGLYASKYASTNEDKLLGVISISSPVVDELADKDLPVLMLYGSLDGIYHGVESDDPLPKDTEITCIEGANHAQFGDYGHQLMDNDATISPEKQREKGTKCMLEWLQEQGIKQPGHYSFDPYLVPEIQTEVCGEKMTKAYHSFIDAVLSGKTSFACEDKTTYDWMLGQYPYACCPVIERYIQAPENHVGFEKGVGYFQYAIPYEEFKTKYDEFAELVSSILNDVLEDDYSDFEKAFALYKYCSDNIEYDQDLFHRMSQEAPSDEEVSPYRTLTEKIGICQNISTAYSFLLQQAGVDATVCSGFRDYDGASHQWSFVRIDGVYYHIDVTYALGSQSLSYFMMTDEQRYNDGGFTPDSFSFVNNYNEEFVHKTFSCKDDRFKEFWDAVYTDIDFKNHKLSYSNYKEDPASFDYGKLTK
ncbi:MAG: hypothetical protein MJ145_01785 [Clostridia bacterium]|nr:hypothetical protein [Clostridia bacterium]